MIHEEICTYEVAKLAKEKGFPLQKVIKQDGRAFFYELPQSHPDWANCDAWYLPTQSLLQRWLREKKGYYVYPFFDNESKRWTWVCRELTGDMWIQLLDFEERYFATYELALEDALKYTLENLV
ncbi:MAG: hypothetical protein J6U69_02340 [Alistipes sp.]|nr:hypothetical protein [Alistipes sp.]